MARSNHTDQRFRDETNLIRLVEHLQRAHDDASAVGSAEALEEDYMRFNSVAMDVVQALQPVDAVSGALMLMPRSLFAGIGGFDEGYRLHAEDLDLCRRARQAGARVAVANDVPVLHVRGVSSRSRPLFVEWHKHRGLWRYYRKFDAPRDGAPTRAAVFAMVWGRFPFAALRAAIRS